VLGDFAIDAPNMKGLILSVIIGKFGKIMESIKTCNFRGFIEEIGGDVKNEDRLLFDALVA
jgi:hypothetical protein